MGAEQKDSGFLDTQAGRLPLLEYRLRRGGREWSVLHVGAVLSDDEETRALVRKTNRVPYGVSLWPSAVALGHEIAVRSAEFDGRRILELGAGVGLPGIVAASFTDRVVQTDHDELVLDVCRRNAQRNGMTSIEHRLSDWNAWEEEGRFDWILGADVLYSESLYDSLYRIFFDNLAPGGRVLLADPFRDGTDGFLKARRANGWGVRLTRWDVGEGSSRRRLGVFELTPPVPDAPGSTPSTSPPDGPTIRSQD